jgi:hypothetical protein
MNTTTVSQGASDPQSAVMPMIHLSQDEKRKRNWFEFLQLAIADPHFFRLDTSPVYYDDKSPLALMKRFPQKKVIIDLSNHEGISMVRSGFLPVPHQRAFDLGVEIYQMLFGVRPMIHKQRINAKRTEYSVDFVSEDCQIVLNRNGYKVLNPLVGASEVDLRIEMDQFNADRPSFHPNFSDVYYPFIRVTNYLRDGKQFSMELGYYRSRCSNGLLMGQETKLVFQHSYFVSTFENIRSSARLFFSRNERAYYGLAEQLWHMLNIHVPEQKMRLITIDIFQEIIFKREKEEQTKLLDHLNALVAQYVEEIGENMNAAVNVATDFSKILYGSTVSVSWVEQMTSNWMEVYFQQNRDPYRYWDRITELEARLKAL